MPPPDKYFRHSSPLPRPCFSTISPPFSCGTFCVHTRFLFPSRTRPRDFRKDALPCRRHVRRKRPGRLPSGLFPLFPKRARALPVRAFLSALFACCPVPLFSPRALQSGRDVLRPSINFLSSIPKRSVFPHKKKAPQGGFLLPVSEGCSESFRGRRRCPQSMRPLLCR